MGIQVKEVENRPNGESCTEKRKIFLKPGCELILSTHLEPIHFQCILDKISMLYNDACFYYTISVSLISKT